MYCQICNPQLALPTSAVSLAITQKRLQGEDYSRKIASREFEQEQRGTVVRARTGRNAELF
jgi:hypothetical protein